jgi:hypothetical protein
VEILALVLEDKYYCTFPGCNYETTHRSKIDFHHVTPRELDERSELTIPLCKTHHALIYHPDTKHGQHSIKTEQSLIIEGVYDSTGGKCIVYLDHNGNEITYMIDKRVAFYD